MKIFEIIGIVGMIITLIVAGYRLHILIFMYSENTCPNDHDNMSRSGNYGMNRCDKCGTEL